MMVTERWAPYKELWSSVQDIVLQRNDCFHHFKSLLRKHKPDFLNLLRNPVKNSEHRSKVQKANSEGLVLKGDTAPQLFSQDLINEALIVSDLFNLNELSAAELLIEGERQKPHYPQLTRGLVAVLLYWDGRKCLTGTLKTLIQCRRGSTWTLEVSEEMVEFLTSFTDELLEHGMAKQILKLVSDIQVEKEMEVLAKQRGLGGPEHRKQVRDLISGVRQDLAECLFNFAGQSNLPLKDTMSILDHLENVESTADDKLSMVNITLLHALLYAFTLPQDVAAQQDEQAMQFLFQHPLLAEKDFIQSVHKRLMKREDWKTPGLKACVQLSWALSLRSVAQIPMALMETMPDTLNSLSFTEALEQDETILDSALTGKVFQFLKENIISRAEFRSEEFFIRRIHGLVTDLIVNMPLKVKEMKNRGDEVARIILLHVMQREEPPTLREDFKHLLELITALYEHEADLQLSVEFWCPASDAFPNGSHFGARRHQRLPQRQISLFKFLRQSGDMLPPLLYIPYLKMLAALSSGPYSARMAFEMLRANGSNSGGISEGSTISWDHFFLSIHRYYNNLKHESSYHDHPSQLVQSLGAVGGQAFMQTTHHHQMAITPQEVEGLRAVLQLLARIVENDDTACLAIHEHPSWNACNGLLGLLQCHVPAVLKGDILLALNQLARIPEISLGLLQAMESIVEVNPQTATVPTRRSISMELEDVEAREEQYHMTCAFLKLTASLLDANNIVNLISGSHSVGFEPYLRFAIDRVFLKFMSRSYKRAEEKYEVATNTLKIFIKLLEQYVPHAEHFVADKKPVESSFSRFAGSLSQTGFHDSMNMSMNSTQGGLSFSQPSSKPPGYLLLLHIMNEGTFFKTVMEVVENCITYLDQFHIDRALEKHLIEAGLLALQLIKITLSLQDSFLSCMRESGCPILVNTLDKLLLGINPRTSKADYIVTITKYICHNATHPRLSLCANEIISCLCRISNSTQREVYSILTSASDKTRQRILHGFVEAIESPRPEIDEDQDKEYDPVDMYHSHCRLTILRLLLLCVDLPVPNLSHFFLGFNLTKPSKTSLQDAGVMESPRTCLHSILSILSFGPEASKNSLPAQPTAVTDTPAMAELCYQLVYRLAANVETTGPVLRYLRSSHDFVYRHMQHLPFKSGGIAKENQLLLQQSWLLQTTAIELFSTASNRQRSHTQRLIQMLFEKQGAPSASVLGTSIMPNTMNSSSAFPGLGTIAAGSNLGLEMSTTSMSTMNGTMMNKSMHPRNDLPQILRVLEELDFIQEFPDPLELNEFVLANVEDALQSCQRTNENGLVYCDLKALGDLLQANVNALQGSDDVERRARANQDVENILRTAIERNQTRQSIHSKLALLNAWRHTLEVSLCACPADLMSKDTKQQILLDILQELMCRVLHADAMAELTAPVAPICLTLVAHLRSCFASQGFGEAQRRSGLVSDISTYQDLNLSQIIQGGPAATIPQNVASSLQVIMKDIIEWLLQAGVLPQVRANLYASLLYYLQMCQKPKGDNDKSDNPSLVGLQTLSMDVYSKLSRDNIKLLRTYGDVLMELVCKDACDGHSICRILALSVLDAIVRVDWEQAWLQFMVKKGYIGIIARSFTQEDEALQQALTPNSDAVRSLYIYEQKMAFICTVSQTQMGARAILDAGILSRLAECSFLEMRPTINETGFDSFLPSLMSRYRQLLFPALKVCCSILATFGGSSHFEASSLVFEFMLAHVESIVNPVLKLQPVLGDVQSLMELNFVTGILCQVAGQDFSSEALSSTIPQPVLVELQAHQSRIRRQLVSLLPHYCVNDRWLKDIERNNQNRDNGEDTQEINLLVHQICANLMSYCTTILRQKVQNLGLPILLFAPRLDEAVDTESMSRQGVPRQPSIGLLVHVLRNTVSKFTTAMDQLSLQKRQLDDVTNLTTQELKEITGCEDQKLSIPQRQSVATIKLRNSIETQEKLLSSFHFIMENSLLLLWQHLDSFVVKSSSGDSAPEGILFRTKGSGNLKNPMRKLQEIPDSYEGPSSPMFPKSNTFGIGRDTVNELKRVLPTCLTDQFLVKLCDIETQWNGRRTCTFIRPIIRRLQRIMKLHTS